MQIHLRWGVYLTKQFIESTIYSLSIESTSPSEGPSDLQKDQATEQVYQETLVKNAWSVCSITCTQSKPLH